MIKMSVYNKKRTLPKRLRKDEDRGGGGSYNENKCEQNRAISDESKQVSQQDHCQHRRQRQPITSYRQCYRFTKHNKLILGLCIVVVFLIENCWAGFACLSNPCIFGVCLDDINR